MTREQVGQMKAREMAGWQALYRQEAAEREHEEKKARMKPRR